MHSFMVDLLKYIIENFGVSLSITGFILMIYIGWEVYKNGDELIGRPTKKDKPDLWQEMVPSEMDEWINAHYNDKNIKANKR